MIPLTTISIWFVIKIAAIVMLLLYLIFALVVVRQIKLMTSTLNLGHEAPVIIIGYLHLAFAVVVLFAALVIL